MKLTHRNSATGPPSLSSDAILEEGVTQFTRTRKNKKVVMLSGIVLLACVGCAGMFLAIKNSHSSSTTNAAADTNSQDATASKQSSSATHVSETSTKSKTDATDPTTETYSLSAFAIGDWGATDDTTSLSIASCCTRRKVYDALDRHAELGVNKLMAMEAQKHKPAVVIGHGDNFYWTGINSASDQARRFEYTFEKRHRDPAMLDVPWVNVMGNHDYGGGSYICTDANGQGRPCNSVAEIEQALDNKFDWQAKYDSRNAHRWVLEDHYYTKTYSSGNVSMEIFNLDMNDIDMHGASDICCQCYSYSKDGGANGKCKNVNRGDPLCFDGRTDLFDACMAKFTAWGKEALEKLQRDVKKSAATWKIVNSHYSPYDHGSTTYATTWMTALKELGGLQLWLYGHTHGEKHDFAEFNLHFIENGAGGGIQSEAASDGTDKAAVTNLWKADGRSDGGSTYGFFTLEASATWLKARYLTFGDGWALTKTTDDGGFFNGQQGSIRVEHCWYIPVDGSKGQMCATS